MFHACLVSTLLCFLYTLRYFYTLSGTNLLTRCHSASCLFSAVFRFRKLKMNILRIGRDKSQSSYFFGSDTENRRRGGGGNQGGHTLGGCRTTLGGRRTTLGRAHRGCGPP